MRGLEPLTTALQERCAASCATPAGVVPDHSKGSCGGCCGGRGVSGLWVARSVSFLGDSLGLVALLLYVEGATGAALAVALLLLAGDFTPGLFGAFAGAIGDRFDLRR